MSGISRDFTRKSVHELRDIIKKNVDDEGQFGFFDWFQDTFLMQELNIQNYVNNVNEYHAKMVDKHNVGSSEFDKILERVHSVDTNYASRLNRLTDQVNALSNRVMRMANMLNPSVITANSSDYAKLSEGIRVKYHNVKVQSNAEIKKCEQSMPLLYDKQWYEKVVSGVEGVAVSAARDFIEGNAYLVLGLAELVQYGPNTNGRYIKTFNENLDNIEAAIVENYVPDKTWYYGGRVVGDTACFMVGMGTVAEGIAAIAGGITVTVGGTAASATGVGAVVGVPAIAVSGVAVAEGALAIAEGGAVAVASGKNLYNNVSQFMQEIEKVCTKTVNNIKAKDIINQSADEANDWWKTEKNYREPPYKPNTQTTILKLEENEKFVRVYDDVNSFEKGQWFMKAEDIEGLSAKQIQEKFALPTEPKYIVDLEIPKGETIRTGEANSLFGFEGGAPQYDAMGQYLGKWSNPRPLLQGGIKK